MQITPENVSMFLLIIIDLIKKIREVNDTQEPQDIDDELIRLDAARMRPSQDIIDEADQMTGG